MNVRQRNKGFALIEIILIICILGILCSMAVITIRNQNNQQKEDQLKKGLSELRKAVHYYYLDHHHYPCTDGDFNRNADQKTLKKQLLWFTNSKGEPSKIKSGEYRFGPYLTKFPKESITENENVVIDTTYVQSLIELKKEIGESTEAKGGWYYQAKTGFWIAYLNQKQFKEYYVFF